MMSTNLTQRKRAANGSGELQRTEDGEHGDRSDTRDSASPNQPFDSASEDDRFTLLEEVVLLGIKDSEVQQN